MATEIETATSPHDTAGAERESRYAPARGPVPTVALAVVVVGSFALYTLLATGVNGPRVHPDEEIYGTAASSLAEGNGLTIRGADYGFGPLFPLVLAGMIRAAGAWTRRTRGSRRRARSTSH